ncbi:MAG: hypothetical protein Q7S10_00265 [bacterium]|nr:hypothetical protein [bacterium]
MAKKIYDIMPPKVANKLENTIRDSDKKAKKAAPRGRKKAIAAAPLVAPVIRQAKAKPAPIYTEEKEKHFPLKEVLIGGAIVLVLLIGYSITRLPKVDIQISPAMETLSLEETILANKTVTAVNTSRKTIPAVYMEEQQTGTEEFNATGNASNDGKATGTITIYNKLNPASPFTLIKGTHFLSNSGKYFIITQKVTIPAAKYQSGKLVAGAVTATVEAKEAGQEYNIGPSQFSIPKLSGSKYYYSISAESTSPMKGGHVGQVKKVTKDDIDAARETLTKKLLDQAEAALRSKLTENDILLDSAMLKNTVSFKASVTADTIAEKFSADAKVKVIALVFKKQDIETFAKDMISSELADDETYLPESVTMDYSFEVIDITGGSATIDLKVSAKSHKSIDINGLVNVVSMESAEQIKQSVNEVYGDGVVDVKTDFWPFWVKTAPKNKNRIHIELKFE